ncbi:UNVERIFIED_CONTAM: Cannabidiolic acid synthase [Sesamum angustifolium]|uniref:Cannabidiolic acid synthase n=1 Tax=Sesamum angustifolium TaxID=2727405 RepID=A0AAW2PAA7_9LAMI
MKTTTPSLSTIFLILFATFSWSRAASVDDQVDRFLNCLKEEFDNYTSISGLVYTSTNSSYSSVLQYSVQNLRFVTESTPQPLVIITPDHESQIPPLIYCAKESHIQIRTRSGGHDFEGVSYVTEVPFVVVDFIKFDKVIVDAEQKTAWVEAGATLGTLYYRIAEKSPTLAFPAGFSIENRWVRTYSGPLGVVEVPVLKTLEEKATQIIHRWQYIAPNIDPRLFILVRVARVNTDQDGAYITMRAAFTALFLGGIDTLVPLVQESFPELGLVRENCTEISWLQSISYFQGFPINLPEMLLNRQQPYVGYFKGKADYVREPIPEYVFEGIWELFKEPDAKDADIVLIPYGGKMDEIPESAIPFPHRAGTLYKMLYATYWSNANAQDADKILSWLRGLYNYTTPYVSKSPEKLTSIIEI